MRAFVGLDPPARVSTGDVAPNRTEAVRHVQAMAAWTEHQRVRSEQMGSMMGIWLGCSSAARRGLASGTQTGPTHSRAAGG